MLDTRSSGTTETPQRAPASSSYTRRPLIGRQYHISVRQGNNKQSHYPQGISGQRRMLRLLKKMSHKSLPSYIIDLCSLCMFFFYLWFISRQHCVGVLWAHNANVASTAIADSPPYHKGTFGGGNASRNWTAPKRTFITPPSRTEPTRTLNWKCAIRAGLYSATVLIAFAIEIFSVRR